MRQIYNCFTNFGEKKIEFSVYQNSTSGENKLCLYYYVCIYTYAHMCSVYVTCMTYIYTYIYMLTSDF